MTSNNFSNLVGQEEVKRKLGFYADAQNATGKSPFIMLSGAKGLGKTQFARSYSNSLKNKDGSKRPFLEINCSTIPNASSFFTQIFLPIVMNNEVTVFFDEAHCLPKDLTNAFLTIFNTEMESWREFMYKEENYSFDFEKQNYIFATTELDKIFPPLKDRLSMIDFAPYEVGELGEIVRSQSKVNIEDDILQDVASTARGNARSAVKRAKEILLFVESRDCPTFNKKAWDEMKYILGIKPMGLSNIEVEILRILDERGDCTLQMLSSVTGMSRSALQRDAEIYLLRQGLLKIDGLRKITKKGVDLLKMVK
jgi:Holliday junction resolvasome RuvABC ATP-dependent DNA helicase subunit|tara:strand:- start:2647 stop:3576 length:930 start_codon:yes stop_codon:yes gene_type:complete